MKYLYDFGLNDGDIETLKTNASDEVYSDLSFFAKLVEKNLNYLKDFGVTNYKDIVLKYPEIKYKEIKSNYIDGKIFSSFLDLMKQLETKLI